MNLDKLRDDTMSAYELCTGPVGYRAGFDHACDVLLPEVSRLVEAMEKSLKADGALHKPIYFIWMREALARWEKFIEGEK